MADIISSPTERGRPQVPYGIGGVQAFGGGRGGWMGGGSGFSGNYARLARKRMMGSARFPGADQLPPPAGMENLTQVQRGYDPESFWDTRGGKGSVASPGGETLRADPGWFGGGIADAIFGQRGEPSQNRVTADRYRALSSAAGWAGNRMQRNMGISQGAGFGAPDDVLRRLLQARLGGGGL